PAPGTTPPPGVRWSITDPVRPARTDFTPAPSPPEPTGSTVRWTIAPPPDAAPSLRRAADDAAHTRWTIADRSPAPSGPPAAPARVRGAWVAPRRTPEPAAGPRRPAGLKPPSDLPPGAIPTAAPPPDPAGRSEPPKERKPGAPRATFGRMRRNKGRSPEYPS